MRSKHVIDLYNILTLFSNEDKETLYLGVKLLKDIPLIQNLNKHYKYKINGISMWNGIGNKPSWMNRIGHVTTTDRAIFSKSLFDSILNTPLEDESNKIYIQIAIILAWINKTIAATHYKQDNLVRNTVKFYLYSFSSVEKLKNYFIETDNNKGKLARLLSAKESKIARRTRNSKKRKLSIVNRKYLRALHRELRKGNNFLDYNYFIKKISTNDYYNLD